MDEKNRQDLKLEVETLISRKIVHAEEQPDTWYKDTKRSQKSLKQLVVEYADNLQTFLVGKCTGIRIPTQSEYKAAMPKNRRRRKKKTHDSPARSLTAAACLLTPVGHVEDTGRQDAAGSLAAAAHLCTPVAPIEDATGHEDARPPSPRPGNSLTNALLVASQTARQSYLEEQYSVCAVLQKYAVQCKFCIFQEHIF